MKLFDHESDATLIADIYRLHEKDTPEQWESSLRGNLRLIGEWARGNHITGAMLPLFLDMGVAAYAALSRRGGVPRLDALRPAAQSADDSDELTGLDNAKDA